METRGKNTKYRRKKLIFSLLLCMVLILSNLGAAPAYAEPDIDAEVEHNHDTEEIHVHDHEEDAHVHDDEVDVVSLDPLGLYVVADDIALAELDDNGDSSDATTEEATTEETTTEESTETATSEESSTEENSGEESSTEQDIEAPVIKITVENEKYHSTVNTSMYCIPPMVTVTDDTALSSVEATIIGASTTTIQGSIDEDGKNAKLDLTGKTGSVTITVRDKAGNAATANVYIAHTLAGRQSTVLEASCTEPEREVSISICSTCGEEYRKVVTDKAGSIPKGHTFKETKVTPCGGSEITIKTCTVCGYVETEGDLNSDSEEHSWETKEKEATCTEDGYKYEECNRCQIIKNYQSIEATGHFFGNWETTTTPDCKTGTDGLRERNCQNANCEVKETVKLSASHTWSGLTTIKEATCDESGYTGYQCTVCGTDRGEAYHKTIPALGHDYSDDHNCTTASVCSKCKQTIPGNESHTLGNYQSDGTYHWQACTNEGCTYETAHVAHVRPEGAADCTKAWICAECGKQVATEYKSHSWSADYQSDGTYHWQTCTHEGCTQTTDKKSHTVNDRRDCTIALTCATCKTVLREAQTQHNYSDAYTYNVSNHYRVCTNVGCNQTTTRQEHIYTDDHDCTTDVKCGICGYLVVYGAKSHKFNASPYYGDEDGHYQMCQNENCDVISNIIKHSGGTATCVSQAVCDICHTSYGDVDAKNHVGTIIQNVKPATTSQEGYTGDEVCTGCNKIIKKGEVIPKLEEPCKHNWKEQKDDEKSWEQCSECGEIRNEKNHTLIQESDANGHWQKCETCAYTTTVIPHTPDENDYDCTTGVMCLECGYAIVEAMAEHAFDEDTWHYDDNAHWHVCTNPDCHQTSKKVSHTPKDNNDCTSAVICADCDHILTAAMDSHNWSSVWYSDADGHYQKCMNIGCSQVHREKHVRVEDDGICTTPVICKICGYEIEAGASAHDFSGAYEVTETGHYQKCQNPGCKEVSAETPHSGGTATCKNQAVCQVCGTAYGDKDPANHVGDVEIQGYVEPTTESEGYTGDTVCTGCGEILSHGTVLDKLEEDHEHVFDQPASDDIGHWNECRCGARDGYEEHTFGDWESDNTSHWHTCTGCGKVVREDHTGGTATCKTSAVCEICGESYGEVDPDNHVGGTELRDRKAATETEPGYTGDIYCLGCGTLLEKGEEIPVLDPGHTHSYGEWKTDGVNHWRECECGEQTDKAAHAGGTATCNTQATCEVCGVAYGDYDITNHTGGTELRDQKAATETEPGYTGDIYCLGCGSLLEKGEEIPVTTPEHTHSYGEWKSDGVSHWRECECGEQIDKASHAGGKATCNTQATCEVCDTLYGDYDMTNHTGGTELRNRKAATETEPGYTGDTYCLGCGSLLEKGEEIPVTTPEHTHSYGEWKSDGVAHWRECECGEQTDKAAHAGGAATCNTQATCEVCGVAYGEYDMTNHTGGTELKDQKAATETEPGYTGDTYCLGCGSLLEKGEEIPVTTPEHTHSYGEWKSDGVSHWRECECGEQTDKASHTGGTASCNTQATCEVCGVAYGDYDMTNHTGATELRNRKEATDTEPGYTGDTYCVACGTLLIYGEEIPVITPGEGSIYVTDATNDQLGVGTDDLNLEKILEACGITDPENHNIEILLSQGTPEGSHYEMLENAIAEYDDYTMAEVYEISMALYLDGKLFTEITEDFGSIQLSLFVGADYAGRNAIVYQIHDGKLLAPYENLTVSPNGYVTISVDQLSAFAVAIENDQIMDEPTTEAPSTETPSETDDGNTPTDEPTTEAPSIGNPPETDDGNTTTDEPTTSGDKPGAEKPVDTSAPKTGDDSLLMLMLMLLALSCAGVTVTKRYKVKERNNK